MTASERDRADSVLERVLQETGARDPREFYRERLRELKDRDPSAYAAAVRHFEEVLVPSVASGAVDALAAWSQYGLRLAELVTPGRAVAVDSSGRAEPYRTPTDPDSLVLHLPSGGTGRALLVGLPRELSPAQRATYDWLVAGRQKLRD